MSQHLFLLLVVLTITATIFQVLHAGHCTKQVTPVVSYKPALRDWQYYPHFPGVERYIYIHIYMYVRIWDHTARKC